MIAGHTNRPFTLFIMITMSGPTNAGKLAGNQAARIHVWGGQYPPATAVCGGQTFCRPHGDSEERQQVHQSVLAPRVEQQSLTGRPVRAGQHITAEGGGQTACGSGGNRLKRRYEQLAPKLWRGMRAVATGLMATVFDRLLHIIRCYHRWGHRKGADDNTAAVAATDKPPETTRRSLGQSAPSAERTERKCGDDQRAGSPV